MRCRSSRRSSTPTLRSPSHDLMLRLVELREQLAEERAETLSLRQQLDESQRSTRRSSATAHTGSRRACGRSGGRSVPDRRYLLGILVYNGLDVVPRLPRIRCGARHR